MKKFFSISNLLFAAVLAALLVMRGPDIWKRFQMQGQAAREAGAMMDIDGQAVKQETPYALVFWATWCGPCTVELGRVQSLIEGGKIPAEKVIAVSIDRDLQAVKDTVKTRGYAFPVVWDPQGLLADQYEVSVTPTIIVIGQDGKIAWATTGLSPLLEIRLKNYLSGEDA